MSFDWYKIINKADFEATELVSRELDLILEGVGLRTVMVTKGRFISLVYDDVILPVGIIEDTNPFIFGGYGVYLDAVDDIWLGIEVP